MSQPEPLSVVRLAIALAALKHKPREQSSASYLLDLQACFQLRESDGRTRVQVGIGHADNDSGLAHVGASEDWRTYALELEKQLATLKTQRDADQELIARLRPDESQAATTNSDVPPPKKRRKKTQSLSKERQEYEWNWDQSHADWMNVLHSQHPPLPSLVEAYISLKGSIASPNDDGAVYASRLSDAILRALETMHVFMFSPSCPTQQQQSESPIPPVQLKQEHIDSARIAMVSPLLMYILRVGLPSLVGTTQDTTKAKRRRPSQRSARETMHTCVDKVLDRFLECVLLPLLRALTPLCVARLGGLLPPPPPASSSKRSTGRRERSEKRSVSTKQADVRTDVLALLGMSLTALDELSSQPQHSGDTQTRSTAASIRNRLGLEAIRELEALYVDPRCSRPSRPLSPTPIPTPTVAVSQSNTSTTETATTGTVTEKERRAKTLEKLVGTRAERVYALARRDAAWFLASTLNLCVSQTGPHHDGNAKGECSELLREALIDRIGKLVRSVDVDAGERSGDGDADRRERNKFGVDPVCQSMLLATCERAMSGFT